MKFNRCFLSILLTSLADLSSNPVFATEETVLPPMQVKPSDYNVSLGQTSRFNREDLEATGSSDWNQVLRNLAGVDLTQSNASTTSGLSFRGAGGGLGVVNLDGVPLFNSSTSFFPLSHFPLDFFESAELRRGLVDTNETSRTLGGSLRLSSRQLNPHHGFWHSEAGSYATVRNNLGLAAANQAGNFTVMGGRSDVFEGVSQAVPVNAERDSFHMNNGLLRWDKDFDNGAVDASVYFVNTRESVDGPGFLPTGRLGWKDDPNGLILQNTWVAQTRGHYALNSKWDSALRLGYTQDSQVGQTGNIFGHAIPIDLTNQLWIAHWENSHQIKFDQQTKNIIMVWGIDTQHQQGISQLNSVSQLDRSNTIVSPIYRAEFNTKDWSGNVVLRHDFDARYGDHTIFTVGASWQISKKMALWGKAGNGYRSPAVNELLHSLFGSLTLRPETSRGGEVGWRWQPSKLDELSLSGYVQEYNNLIVMEQNPYTGSMGSINHKNAEVLGAELSIKHTWNTKWQSEFSYGYMSARDPVVHKQIGYRPEHQGQFATIWQISQPLKLRVGLSFRDSYWIDSVNSLRIAPAPRLNANLDYQIHSRFRVYLRGENLNNERVPDLYGFNYVGASVYGGMHLDW